MLMVMLGGDLDDSVRAPIRVRCLVISISRLRLELGLGVLLGLGLEESFYIT